MKTYKMMLVDNIAIEIDEGCRAKDVSRVRMKVKEDGEDGNISTMAAMAHTTKAYAEINGNELHWT